MYAQQHQRAIKSPDQAVFGIIPGQNSSFLIFCSMELKFGTGVNSEALISNSSQKIDINTF